MLKSGDVFRTPTGDLWYVDYVTYSGAYCIALTTYHADITTRKGHAKKIRRHLPNSVFAPNAIVDLVDPRSLNVIQLQRRLAMARKEGTVMAEVSTVTPEPAPISGPPRTASRYVRTAKAPAREMRGQAKETYDAIPAAGSTPVSVSDIAAKCAYLGSRQDKDRVAGFYVARFKKDGLIEPVSNEPPPPMPA